MSDDKNDNWEMPQPVFRTSTGALPRSLEETISQSFMPNAETIEIDPDDDILSIMDTVYQPQTPKFAADIGGEKTLEIEHDAILEIDSAPVAESVRDEHNPIVVSAREPDEKAFAASAGPGSNLVVFIAIGLIAVAIIAAFLYNASQSSTIP